MISQSAALVGRYSSTSLSRDSGAGHALLEIFAPRESVLCDSGCPATTKHKHVHRRGTGSMVFSVQQITGVPHPHRCCKVARAALQVLTQLPVRAGLPPAGRTLMGIHDSPSHGRRVPYDINGGGPCAGVGGARSSTPPQRKPCAVLRRGPNVPKKQASIPIKRGTGPMKEGRRFVKILIVSVKKWRVVNGSGFPTVGQVAGNTLHGDRNLDTLPSLCVS
jgi:hypothetical protein